MSPLGTSPLPRLQWALASARRMRSPLIELLARELAPNEGRAQAVLRIATACSITVAIAMVFQIPEPTYMAYIVFLIAKDEISATVITGVGAMLAVTLAAVLNLGLLLIDTAEPALRLPAMALATFVGMYAVRTFALGPISYLAGFVVVLLQSVVDDIPSPEALTRLGLWVWVVVLVPIATIVMLNLAFAPASKVLLGRTWRRILSELESGLRSRISRADLARWREAAVPLLSKLNEAASGGQSNLPVSASGVERLLEVLTILEVLPEKRIGGKSPAEVALQSALARMYEALTKSSGTILDGESRPEGARCTHRAGGQEPALDKHAEQDSAACLGTGTAPRNQPAGPPAQAQPPKHKQLFVPDAFSNPAHWQFALKTTIAVMVVYITYTLLNYPGLRTSIVTCFFVALGSLGETVHKLTLRVSGAIIGGLLAGICIVWVLPHMTDIGQLCALIALVAAGAGWIATSSERLAYAGMQIAFAFFLGVLQGYAPATDLSVLRDRVAGILLGNVVIALVFSMLWPESARTRLRTSLVEALRALSDLLKAPENAGQSRIRATQALVQSQRYSELSAFELQMLPAEANRDASALEGVRRAAGAAFVATSDAFTSLPDIRQSQISTARSTTEHLRSEIEHATGKTQ
jgi:multidrug resistance protein MdtO